MRRPEGVWVMWKEVFRGKGVGLGGEVISVLGR